MPFRETLQKQPMRTKQNNPSGMSFRPEHQRSGGIYPSCKNNRRRVNNATWEDPSAPFHFGRDDTSIGDTVQPHELYSLRCLAMDHRRYIAWFHSTTRVVNVAKTTCVDKQNHPQVCHSDRSVSGVEESTTLDKEPTQGKTGNSGRFLDSHSLPRNDMSICGSIQPYRL